MHDQAPAERADVTLVGAIDTPGDDERCARAVLVSGWAVSPDGGVLRIEARVDDGSTVTLHPGRPRPDVEANHPGGGALAGFSGLLLIGDGAPRAILHVVVTDDRHRMLTFRRTIDRVPSSPPPTARTAFDTDLASWLSTPTDPSDPLPRSTVGAVQLHRALDLSGSFPDLRGPGRFAYLEWLYHLWKNEGDDAIPFALVATVWLPPQNRPPPTLPADWIESTWGHLAVPWLNDDVADPVPHQPLLSRAALLVWSRRTILQRRFPDPLGADRQSLASWLATHRHGLSTHVELAAPLGSDTAVGHRRRTVRTRLASLGRRSATPAEHLLAQRR